MRPAPAGRPRAIARHLLFLAGAAADGVRGKRLAQHVGERLRRVGGRGAALGHEAFDAGDQLLHLLAAGFDVELGAAERVGMGDQRALERVDEPRAERIRARAARPSEVWFQRVRSERTRSSRSATWAPAPSVRLRARRAALPSSATSCLAVGLLRLQLNLVAPLVAIEERVARRCGSAARWPRTCCGAPGRWSSSPPAAGGSRRRPCPSRASSASSSARAHSASFFA